MRKMEEGKTKDYNREKREKRKREKGKERERNGKRHGKGLFVGEGEMRVRKMSLQPT